MRRVARGLTRCVDALAWVNPLALPSVSPGRAGTSLGHSSLVEATCKPLVCRPSQRPGFWLCLCLSVLICPVGVRIHWHASQGWIVSLCEDPPSPTRNPAPLPPPARAISQ